MNGEIVDLNGERLSTPPTQQDHISKIMQASEEYAQTVADLINREVQLFMENRYPDGYTEEHLNQLNLEELHQAPDRAIVSFKRKVVRANFPVMKWEEKTIPHILFKDIDNATTDTEIVRYWEKRDG